jgi:hypothetical protein
MSSPIRGDKSVVAALHRLRRHACVDAGVCCPAIAKLQHRAELIPAKQLESRAIRRGLQVSRTTPPTYQHSLDCQDSGILTVVRAQSGRAPPHCDRSSTVNTISFATACGFPGDNSQSFRRNGFVADSSLTTTSTRRAERRCGLRSDAVLFRHRSSGSLRGATTLRGEFRNFAGYRVNCRISRSQNCSYTKLKNVTETACTEQFQPA